MNVCTRPECQTTAGCKCMDASRPPIYQAMGIPLQKRPVAFRAPNGRGGWIVTQDEQEARDVAEIAGADYQGLYVRDGS